MTSKAELERLVKDLSSKEKYLNLLVTNAGQSGPKNPPDSDSAAVGLPQNISFPYSSTFQELLMVADDTDSGAA